MQLELYQQMVGRLKDRMEQVRPRLAAPPGCAGLGWAGLGWAGLGAVEPLGGSARRLPLRQ
jgi:hypothetical protein